jgi:hypothetical protein|tara:strand:+ start:900 stop:1154 length:255 start_codon:yes stop_codon:yes gene_type:complete
MEQQEQQNSYQSRRRKARVIPFGYKIDDIDESLLIPVEEELNALKEAEKYLQNCSYKEVAEWIMRKTNRKVTGMGLRKIMLRGW